jgi:hypothetical protein
MTDAENFSLSHRLQTEFEAHLASYQTGTGNFSTGVEWPVHESDDT